MKIEEVDENVKPERLERHINKTKTTKYDSRDQGFQDGCKKARKKQLIEYEEDDILAELDDDEAELYSKFCLKHR
jgi:hypothetical protein